MSPRVRLAVFLAAAAGLAALLGWGVAGLPAFGRYEGAYGLVLNRTAVQERKATNVPTAVNFDYRSLDTLGEEFILFTAAVGLAVILRSRREEEQRPPSTVAEIEREVRASDATRVVGIPLVGSTVVLGLYVVTHGHLSPGGGFQGGVVLAAALLLVYLTGEYLTMRRVRPWPLIESTKSVGAGGLAALGLVGLIGGAAYFENVLPLGPVGELRSGGIIPLANAIVALEVAAAFVMVFSEFLEQALVVRR